MCTISFRLGHVWVGYRGVRFSGSVDAIVIGMGVREVFLGILYFSIGLFYHHFSSFFTAILFIYPHPPFQFINIHSSLSSIVEIGDPRLHGETIGIVVLTCFGVLGEVIVIFIVKAWHMTLLEYVH